jgi:hypothetical protein
MCLGGRIGDHGLKWNDARMSRKVRHNLRSDACDIRITRSFAANMWDSKNILLVAQGNNSIWMWNCGNNKGVGKVVVNCWEVDRDRKTRRAIGSIWWT